MIRSHRLLVLCVLIFTLPVYAYLDPGSGSMIFQLIVGGIAGLILAIKIFGQRIKAFFSFGKRSENETDSAL